MSKLNPEELEMMWNKENTYDSPWHREIVVRLIKRISRLDTQLKSARREACTNAGRYNQEHEIVRQLKKEVKE